MDNLSCGVVESALGSVHTTALAYLCLQVWLIGIAVDFQIVNGLTFVGRSLTPSSLAVVEP